ncbi:MAG: hypothetical protein ACKV19_17005 [Verrucomicrobiales bacterium]
MPGRNRFRQVLAGAAAAWLFLSAAGFVHADIQQGGQTGKNENKEKDARQEAIRRAAQIPTPKDMDVTVLRGVPLRITLSATASLRQPVIFRLGERPSHGALSDPRPSSEGPTQAVVTYTAGPGTANADSFTFRVKHRDTPTSGSATVRLRIVDPVPDLIAPTELDFGNVIVGESAVRPLVLENKGTAAFSAALALEPPWRLMQESPTVWIDAGAKAEIRLAFAPLSPGDSKTPLAYPGVETPATRLIGRALAPVRLQPSLVQLAWDTKARSRRASVTLENRLQTPVEYTLASSPRLQFSAERGTLPGQGTAEVTVELLLPDAEDFQSLLSVIVQGVREEVPVTGPPAPALLTLRETEGWQRADSKLVLNPDASEGAVVVANEGGESASLIVTLPEGWTSPGLRNVATLGPRESRRLLIIPPTPRTASVTGRLGLRLAEDRLDLKLEAPAAEAPATAANSIGPDALLTAAPTLMTEAGRRDLTAQERQLQFMIDTLGIFPHDTRFDRSLPELQAVTVGKMHPDQVPLSLKSPGADYTIVVFRDIYRPPPGGIRPTRHWLPIDGLKWKSTGESVATTLDGLAPGGRLLLRFAVRTADGRIGPPSNPVAITTPAPKPRRWHWWVGAVALAGVVWWWRRRRLAER